VVFTNVQIVNGNLLILSDIGTWYALGVTDDGAGSYTTNLTLTSNTGSYYASSSVYYYTQSIQLTSSFSSSWASSSLSSSYAQTASYALNGGGAGTTLNTGSLYPITSSWAISASWSPSVASSFAVSSSWASSSLSSSYLTPDQPSVINTTNSANWITCSFLSPSQQVNLTTALTYNFTASNLPGSGKVSDIALYINHTAAGTSSLSFPSTWKNIGSGWPTSIAASTVGVLWLRAIDTTSIIGSFNVSGSIGVVIPTSLTTSSVALYSGVMLYNTSSNLMYIYNGTSWKSSSFS
jgi:hypothetical protein